MIQLTYYMHSLLSFLIVLFGMLTSLNVFAACAKDSKTLFACNTTKGKRVEVCDAGKTISYSFGKRGAKPEIALTLPREQVTTYQWLGIGSTMSYSIDIPNGDIIYTVYESLDRVPGYPIIKRGVYVFSKGKLLMNTNIKCLKQTNEFYLEGVDLAITP
jgi:hypothetical protein